MLWAILLVSAALRVSLALSGGQDFWADEDTANPGYILEALIAHDYGTVFSRLDYPSTGPIFKIIGLIPAAIAAGSGHARTVYALFFGMATVVEVWLLAGIARRLGAGDVEALIAAAFLALSVTFLYWSRHVQSYDLAMMFALLGLYVGLGPGQPDRRVYLCGALGGCSFLSYPGYWTTVVAVALICAIERAKKSSEFLRYDVLIALGVITTVGVAIGMSVLLGGQLLQRFLSYSGNINQGVFAEGWSLPFEYLWHAEHLLLGVWIACVACWLWQPSALVTIPRLRAGLVGLVVIYAALAICSVALHRFVVYGRLARQLVPFFCLVAAFTVDGLRRSDRRSLRHLAAVVMAGLVVQAAVNFREPFLESFPADFIERNRPDAAVTARYQRLMWVNTKFLYPGPEPITLPARYVTLAEARHPLEFLPYQYEGFPPDQRQALRAADIHMRLLGVLP
jgi:hypothetical protein